MRYGNRLDDVEAAEQDELAVESLALAARKVGEIGAVVLLEPLSGAPRYPLLTAADAANVIERVENNTSSENIRLLADLYHLTVNGDDVSTVISRYGERIGHVQVADAPGRHEPGTATEILTGTSGSWPPLATRVGFLSVLTQHLDRPEFWVALRRTGA